MPKVLMVGPSLDAMGGIATVESSILEAMRCKGDSVAFVSTYEEGSKLRKLVIAAAAYARYRQELPRCELVHVHMASRGSFRRKRVFVDAAFNCKRPVVLHLHGSELAIWYDQECSEREKADISQMFNRCAKVIVLSEEWRDYLLGKGICDPNRIEVLHNAVKVPDDNMTDYTRNVVLFMGRLGERKNPGALISAAARLLDDYPDAHFVFGGDGDPSRYEKMAADLGVAANCEFIGWVKGEGKDKVFRESSIYCLPSKNEGMPMSVLEAMSYGIAAVSTPVGGVPQVISDGVDGLLFPVDDVDALVEKLALLMGDEQYKRRIGEQGRVRIKEAFSLEAFMHRIGSIYDEVCK